MVCVVLVSLVFVVGFCLLVVKVVCSFLFGCYLCVACFVVCCSLFVVVGVCSLSFVVMLLLVVVVVSRCCCAVLAFVVCWRCHCFFCVASFAPCCHW